MKKKPVVFIIILIIAIVFGITVSILKWKNEKYTKNLSVSSKVIAGSYEGQEFV